METTASIPARPGTRTVSELESLLALERRRFQEEQANLQAEIESLKANQTKMTNELKRLTEELQNNNNNNNNNKKAQDDESANSRKSSTRRTKRRRVGGTRTESTTAKKKKPRNEKKSNNDETSSREKETPNNNKFEKRWTKKLDWLVEFRHEHGHCNVPIHKKYEKHPELSKWVSQQRTLHKALVEGKPSSLTAERIQKLTELGFQFRVQKPTKGKRPVQRIQHADRWNIKYEQLVRFHNEHGHVNITKRDKDHALLYYWTNEQRTQHRFLREGKPTSMTPERIRRLADLGFRWSVSSSSSNGNGNPPWEERMAQLRDFKERHGHVNVPQKCTDCAPGLGNFVLQQRRIYKAIVMGGGGGGDQSQTHSLTRERIAELEALGFEWFLRNRGGKYPFLAK